MQVSLKEMRERRPGEQTCREAAHWVHLQLPQEWKLLPGQPGQLLLRQHLQHAHGSTRPAFELHTSQNDKFQRLLCLAKCILLR